MAGREVADKTGSGMTTMASMTGHRSPPWTRQERERDEQAREIRAARNRQRTPEERLEETLRLSRFMSELRRGVPGDVRAR
jgi:hypothetical protein